MDYLQKIRFSGNGINKAEHNGEDLSQFKDETIRTELKDKIYDSSVTLVLISPGMKDMNKPEDDQWIPWEISYSLREQTRNFRTSNANAIIAMVLPDRNNSYDYYWKEEMRETITGMQVQVIYFDNTITFEIMSKNMFNEKNPTIELLMNGGKMYVGKNPSYISVVKWDTFLSSTKQCIENAIDIQKNINNYHISKLVKE